MGSDGCNVIFPVGHLDEIAALLKLKRRRLVTEKERERLWTIHHFQATTSA
jgi:hypothetical protein